MLNNDQIKNTINPYFFKFYAHTKQKVTFIIGYNGHI